MTIVWSFAGVFQSTLSVRRATGNIGYNRQNVLISIHALRKESDEPTVLICAIRLLFQSTLSVRRAT